MIKLEGGTDFDLTVLNPKEILKAKQGPEPEKKETDKKIKYGTLFIHLFILYKYKIKFKYLNSELMNIIVVLEEILMVK